MTGSEIKALNTQIRGGREMDDVTFYTLLNMEKKRIEIKRPWRFLITEDTSNTSSANDTFLTAHDLPDGFLMFPNRDKLKLVNTVDTTDVLKDWTETKFETRYEKQNNNGYFVVDLKNLQYYLLGKVTKNYTHHMFFCEATADITANTEWENVPADFAKLLAFAVAVIDEAGMDYDEVNARQASGNSLTCRSIESAMVKWDDNLIRGMLQV